MAYNKETMIYGSAPTYWESARYLKTMFQENKERFKGRFMTPFETYLKMHEVENYQDILRFYNNLWDQVEPFSYKEAFAIKGQTFRAEVFSVINVPEMISNLGSERIKASGIELTNMVYDVTTRRFNPVNFTQMYELHKVNCTTIGITNNVYAVKCWCTSTNQEHWLWVSSEIGRKGDPLEAIASTCRVYKSMLGNIDYIIRQGDVFIFGMKKQVTPNEDEEVVSMTKKDYFSLLKSQS